MKYNQIEVLFFSKNLQLRETFASLFFDEVDFSCRSYSSLDELRDLHGTPFNKVGLIDLSGGFYLSDLIVDTKNSMSYSLPIIFILDNQRSKFDFKKKGFTCFEIILKPVNVDELLSTIRTLLANKIFSKELPIPLGDNWFVPKKNMLKNSQGQSIKLTEKETKIINFLYEGRGDVSSKDLILRSIWGYKETISTHTLETHIYRLRKKLETGLNEKNLILKNSKGYFLNLP